MTHTQHTQAQRDSLKQTPFDIQRLLRKVNFPVHPKACRVMDERGLVFKGKKKKPVFVDSAAVNALMHAIAFHLNPSRLTSDASGETLLMECGMSRKSKTTIANASKFLRYTWGILQWEKGGQVAGKNNSYWFKVAAVRQLITNQGISKLDGSHAQLLFGDGLYARFDELERDPYFGAKLHEVSRSGATHSREDESRRESSQPHDVSRPRALCESSLNDANCYNSKNELKNPEPSPVVGPNSPTGVQAHPPAIAKAPLPAKAPRKTEPSAAALALAKRFYAGTGMQPPPAEAWKLERLHERAQAGAEYTEAEISVVAEHFLTDPFYASKMSVGMFVKSFPRWLFEFRKKGIAISPAAAKSAKLVEDKGVSVISDGIMKGTRSKR